jgi:two-component system phosphate regulon sensor histidine kinase PhoR
VNGESERARALVGGVSEPVIVLDHERRLVAASPSAAAALGDATPGRRVGEDAFAAEPHPLVLFLAALPELSAYQELRAGFTAAVSHELRTPLARLLVLLESATLPGADIDGLVDQARQEIQQTRDLIDDVLFLGELETGREVVSLGRTRARGVIDEVVASLADRAEHAEVRLVVKGGPDVELPLRPRMIRVVVENLVANAIRYSGPGSMCTVSVAHDGTGVTLAVADDGSGVPERDLSRLFERFYRADQARTSRGTGLGLAIVKHIVTSAGGTVDADSAPGQGLQIVCRFP